MSEQKSQIAFYIPKELHTEVKVLAAKQDMSMQEFYVKSIQNQVISEKEKENGY